MTPTYDDSMQWPDWKLASLARKHEEELMNVYFRTDYLREKSQYWNMNVILQ